RMFAHRSFLDPGVQVAGSSDWPCGPMEPLLGIKSCVTRLGADGTEVGVNQRIRPQEALALYTSYAARARGVEFTEGRLDPGFVADFLVLSDFPDDGWPDDIAVQATFVGGRQV